MSSSACLILRAIGKQMTCWSRRTLTTSRTWHTKTVSVTFVGRDGERTCVRAAVGQTLLDAVVNNHVELEGFGACGGSLSCSTCHVILSEDDYSKVASQVQEEELDLLDLASQVTETSRLGCQVLVTEELDGVVVQVPRDVKDARELSGQLQGVDR